MCANVKIVLYDRCEQGGMCVCIMMPDHPDTEFFVVLHFEYNSATWFCFSQLTISYALEYFRKKLVLLLKKFFLLHSLPTNPQGHSPMHRKGIKQPKSKYL